VYSLVASLSVFVGELIVKARHMQGATAAALLPDFRDFTSATSIVLLLC